MAATRPHSMPSTSHLSGGPAQERAEPPSPWLYLAGLCVTLSGLFAVNYGLEPSGFSQMVYALAISGYVINYMLRLSGRSIRSFQAPLLLLIGLAAIFLLTNDGAATLLAPPGVEDDRSKSLQLIFAWMAIAHSFVVSSDASVLFSCVPCMTMLALVSTHTPDSPVQAAFMVFIAAATFLMVHENYLRTRSARLRQRTLEGDRRLFGGQLQLTALCLAGALALANLVAVPIRSVGQTLFDINYGGIEGRVTRTLQSAVKVAVKEQSSVKLATGPQTESDQVVLTIHSDRRLNWRGKTYVRYTGQNFTNDANLNEQTLEPDKPSGNGANSDPRSSTETDYDAISYQYHLPISPYELKPEEMRSSTDVTQVVTVQGGSFTQFYGAGMPVSLETSEPRLHVDDAGSMTIADSLHQYSRYKVISRVATEDPNLLRSASSIPADLPPLIRRDCLQTEVNGVQSERLKRLASQITQGLRNNFDRAVAIKEYLSQHCAYNLLAVAAPLDHDAVEYFVFDAKEGYCDSFGAAMTLLCRYAGVPARFVSGFLSGDAGNDNSYTVKVKHKHIWTEVFFPHYGWVAFDSTEGTQDVTNRTRARQASGGSLLQWLRSHGPVPILVVAVISLLLAYLIKVEILARFAAQRARWGLATGRPAANLEIIQCYRDACRLLASRGLKRPEWMTPDEYSELVEQSISQTLPSPQTSFVPEFTRLTHLHEVACYGAAPVSDAEAAEAKQLLSTLEKASAYLKRGALSMVRDVQTTEARWATGGATSSHLRRI